MIRLRKDLLLIVLVLGAAVLLSGCEDEPGLLDELAGKRLGIFLKLDGYEQTRFRSAVVQYVSRRVPMQVVGVDDYSEDKAWNDSGLDYLLVAEIVDGPSTQESSKARLETGEFDVRVTYECVLSLRYKLLDLGSGEILTVGESTGKDRETIKFGVSKTGLDLNLSRVDQDELIEGALIDAVRRTDLI